MPATRPFTSSKFSSVAIVTPSFSSVKVTAAEKRVLELYRAADRATKKNAEAVLKGDKQVQEEGGSIVTDLLGGVMETLLGGKK